MPAVDLEAYVALSGGIDLLAFAWPLSPAVECPPRPSGPDEGRPAPRTVGETTRRLPRFASVRPAEAWTDSFADARPRLPGGRHGDHDG